MHQRDSPTPWCRRRGRATEFPRTLLGAWLSLVERFVRDEEVARSNRVAPTTIPAGSVFSRFNAASCRVLRAAEQECRNHNHYYIGAEHLLEALLQEHDPGIIAVLQSEGIDVREVHAEVRQAL